MSLLSITVRVMSRLVDYSTVVSRLVDYSTVVSRLVDYSTCCVAFSRLQYVLRRV